MKADFLLADRKELILLQNARIYDIMTEENCV